MLRIKYVEFVRKYTGEWYVFDKYRLHVKAMIYYCNIKIWMEIEKSEVLIQFLLFFRQSGDVLFFLYARRLRRYTATLPLSVKGHSLGPSSFPFSMRSAHRWLFQIEITIVESSQSDQSPVLIQIINEDFCWLMRADEFTKSTLSLTEYIRKFSVVLLSARNFLVVSVENGEIVKVK